MAVSSSCAWPAADGTACWYRQARRSSVRSSHYLKTTSVYSMTSAVAPVDGADHVLRYGRPRPEELMVLPPKTALRDLTASRLGDYRTMLVVDSATLETWREAHQTRRGIT